MIDLISRMKEARLKLGNSEKIVLDKIFNHMDEVLQMTQKELAKFANVSQPTVMRFCQSINCKSYRQFIVELAQNLAIQKHINKGEGTLEPTSENQSQQLANVVFNTAISTLTRSLKEIDFQILEHISNLIYKSNFVSIFGMGGSSMTMSQMLYARLVRLGINVKPEQDIVSFQMNSATITKNDLVIVFSTSGRIEQLNEAVSLYKNYGIPVVCISDKGSPLTKLCDLSIQLNIIDNQIVLSPGSYRYTLFGIIDVLATYVAYQNKEKSLDLLRKQHLILSSARGEFIKKYIGD